MATERRIATMAVDGPDVPPTPEALRAALGPPLADDGSAGRTVVVLDSYELFAPIDDAFRSEIAPGLPADTLLVIADRPLFQQMAHRSRLVGSAPGSWPWRT